MLQYTTVDTHKKRSAVVPQGALSTGVRNANFSPSSLSDLLARQIFFRCFSTTPREVRQPQELVDRGPEALERAMRHFLDQPFYSEALNLETYDSIVLGHIIQGLVIGLGVWIIQIGGMCLLEAYRIQSEKRTLRDFTQAALERMRAGGPAQRRWFEETSRDVTRLLELLTRISPTDKLRVLVAFDDTKSAMRRSTSSDLVETILIPRLQEVCWLKVRANHKLKKTG